MLRRLIGEDIKVNTHLASDLRTIKADHGTLGQVIMNLAVNARDAMPNGGEQIIKTENVTLTEANAKRMTDAPKGKCIRISVSDKGTGMDEKNNSPYLRSIFQYESSWERNRSGTFSCLWNCETTWWMYSR